MKKFYSIFIFTSVLFITINALSFFSLTSPIIQMIASIIYLIVVIILIIKLKNKK